MGPNTERTILCFPLSFYCTLKMNGGKSFTRAIRAESTLRDQTGLLAGWPLWDTTCLFLSHESQCLPPSSFTLCSNVSDVCQHEDHSQLQNDLINFSLPVWGCCETLIFYQSVVPCQLRVHSWLRAVFHGLPLTTSHDSYFTANTVGLWLHSSGNGLHKKEVNPHVGTRPGLGMLTLLS